jgi:hypothetical protein
MDFLIYFDFGIIPGDDARILKALLPSIELIQRDSFDEYRLKKYKIIETMTLEKLFHLSSHFDIKMHGCNIEVSLP